MKYDDLRLGDSVFLDVMVTLLMAMALCLGIIHILRNNFLEVTYRILQLEVATVGSGHRPQHLWSHRNPKDTRFYKSQMIT